MTKREKADVYETIGLGLRLFVFAVAGFAFGYGLPWLLGRLGVL